MITIHEKNYNILKYIAIIGESIAFIVAFLLTGMYAAILNHDFANAIKIGHMFQAFKEVGFPFAFFLLLFVVLSCLVGYAVYLRWKKIENTDLLGRFNFAKSKGDNDADFISPKDFKTDLKNICIVESAETARGMIYGSLDKEGKKVVDYKNGVPSDYTKTNDLPNSNAMFIGESGIGKGISVTRVQIFQSQRERHSFIVTDPSLENYRDFAPYLERCGYRVLLYAPNKPEISDGWNALDNETANIESHASFLARSIIRNAPGYDPKQANTCITLIRAVILLVALDPYREKEKKNLNEVIDVLFQPGGKEYMDDLFSVKELVLPDQEPARLAYQSYLRSSANYSGNIFSDLASYLAKFQESKIREIFKGDDISFVDLCTKPTAIFAGIPAGPKTEEFTQLVSMFFKIAFATIYDFAEQQPNGRSPIHVDFIADEARAIGYLDGLGSILETARKYNCSILTIFQDLSQFMELYGEKWNSIANNSATKVILGVSDFVTPEQIEKFIGDTAVENETEKIEAGEPIIGAERDKTRAARFQSLLPASVITKLDKKINIVLFSHQNPLLLYKFEYWKHPFYKYLGEPRNLNDIPDISDTEGRKAYRAKQDEVIAKYYEYTKDDNTRDYKELWEEPEPTDAWSQTKNTALSVWKKILGFFVNIKNRISAKVKDRLDSKGTQLNQNFYRQEIKKEAPEEDAPEVKNGISSMPKKRKGDQGEDDKPKGPAPWEPPAPKKQPVPVQQTQNQTSQTQQGQIPQQAYSQPMSNIPGRQNQAPAQQPYSQYQLQQAGYRWNQPASDQQMMNPQYQQWHQQLYQSLTKMYPYRPKDKFDPRTGKPLLYMGGYEEEERRNQISYQQWIETQIQMYMQQGIQPIQSAPITNVNPVQSSQPAQPAQNVQPEPQPITPQTNVSAPSVKEQPAPEPILQEDDSDGRPTQRLDKKEQPQEPQAEPPRESPEETPKETPPEPAEPEKKEPEEQKEDPKPKAEEEKPKSKDKPRVEIEIPELGKTNIKQAKKDDDQSPYSNTNGWAVRKNPTVFTREVKPNNTVLPPRPKKTE